MLRSRMSELSNWARIALVCALCIGTFACGTRPGRDLSMQGALGKFDERRAGTRAQQARAANPEKLRGRDVALKPFPQRRELLQVRVPANAVMADIVDGVVATSIAGVQRATPGVPSGARGNAGARNANQRSLQAQIEMLNAQIEMREREIRGKWAAYDRKKMLLDQMDMRHSKTRDLLLQGFKIRNEKLLQKVLASIDEAYQVTEPETVFGLQKGEGSHILALFGRNEMARPDEYVDLKKSFLFVGGDISTGISLGRMDDLNEEISSRDLNVNLAGLRLPTALKSLARSINLPVYVSPGVEAAPQKVRLEISKADALDIFDILIDNYALAMAYDRKMGVARFYTLEEFTERVNVALSSAKQHNKRARNYRKISQLENDGAAIKQIYTAYFKNSDDAGRARSLTNNALIEADYSTGITEAIIVFKETALKNEKKLGELDLTNSGERQKLALVTQAAKFVLDDANKVLTKLLQTRTKKQTALSKVKRRRRGQAKMLGRADNGELTQVKPRRLFLSGPDAEVLRGRVIQDANLATTEPIYTEKFTIYNSEGSNSCGGKTNDRVTQIKVELENYYAQLYPDELIAAERAAERAARRAERKMATENFSNNQLAALTLVNTAIDVAPAGAVTTQAGGALAQSNITPVNITPGPPGVAAPGQGGTQAQGNTTVATPGQAATGGNNADDDRFGNSNFRRPTVTSVADTVIVTGFQHDVELAASLIESLDQADKQVLVEVFMVNVVKNWQRQLQGRLQNALRTADQTDGSISSLPGNIRSEYKDLVDVRDNGLIGVRGALNFANRAAAASNFTLNNFRLGLAWTVDFMEKNSLGRKVSSPTILALDGCPAKIIKSETRYLPVTTTSAPVVTPGGQTVPGQTSTNYEARSAELKLEVTPTINPLNDHVRLKVVFNDDFFVTSDANSDKIQSVIDTQFISAPGDVIVLAGLYTEDNSKTRDGLPGIVDLPFISSILGTSSDQLKTQEMVIFMAPEVITPEAGKMPINSAVYYGTQ